MKNKPATIAAIAVALTSIFAPIWLALRIANDQGLDAERSHLLAYARDVLHRSDATADQIKDGIERLLATHSADPCSPANLAIMRQIDLTASYIQGIGYVANNQLVCSSLSASEARLDLGPVDWTTSRGTSLRTNVHFPFDNRNTFLVVEQSHFAAVINKDLPVDATTDENDISLATFSTESGAILASRGLIKTEWLKKLGNARELDFVDHGQLVAIVRSQKYLTAAIAALPISYLNRQMRKTAMLLVPFGILAGLVLGYSVLYAARIQQSMPTAIRTGLRRNEFFLVFQPVVDLRTRRWVGAEALLRWRTSSGELIPPNLFIPVAEHLGLMQRITGRVIKIVGEESAGLFQRYPDFHIAINFSAADLHAPKTVELLKDLLKTAKASPKNLIVEATERGFLSAESAKEIIHKIRQQGIRTAIDDFGTGYSSLAYLETFEMDFLKIDKSFVDTIDTEAPTRHVVLHIIELAKDLKLEMIAEGVETEHQAEFLRERGVQFAQGWLFAKPMTLSELVRNLAKTLGEGAASAGNESRPAA